MAEVNDAIQELFREVFIGTALGAEGTYFVQGNEAFWATLDSLTAEEASRKLSPECSSIAAHVIHTQYYLDSELLAWAGGQPGGDWAGSWARQAVTDSEWHEAKGNLRASVARFLTVVADVELVNYDLRNAIANVAHAAYHLGAIRQLYLVIKAGQ